MFKNYNEKNYQYNILLCMINKQGRRKKGSTYSKTPAILFIMRPFQSRFIYKRVQKRVYMLV